MVENILKFSLDITRDNEIPAGKRKTLEAAVLLFSKKGYQGTSTLEIAQAAGVSQATIFKYFKTKEDLLLALVAPVLPQLFSNILGNINTIETTEELIHFIVQDRFAFLKENKHIIKILLSEVLTNETLRNNLLLRLEEVNKEKGVEVLLEKIFKTKADVNQELTILEIVRSIVAPILAYFWQRFILFDGLTCETEEHDLRVIEQQICRSLTL